MNNYPESFPDLSELIAPKLTRVVRFVGGLVTKLGFHDPPDYRSDHYRAPLDSALDYPAYQDPSALDDAHLTQYWQGVFDWEAGHEA